LFVDARLSDSKIVYRRYASLFFIAGCASTDNELITLEIVHRYVEQMDKYYGNVCEVGRDSRGLKDLVLMLFTARHHFQLPKSLLHSRRVVVGRRNAGEQQKERPESNIRTRFHRGNGGESIVAHNLSIPLEDCLPDIPKPLMH
jgi:hypothetical protein